VTVLLKLLLAVVRWLFPGSRSSSLVAHPAFVQVSVMSGASPALQVVRDPAGYWLVSDGRADIEQFDDPARAVRADLSHAALWDETVAALASMSPGTVATRHSPNREWNFWPL
jgi:hypothetical protein